jgi:hypothetical protein
MKILNRFFFLFITMLVPFLGEAKIIETTHMADALPYIDTETWFLVDLDNCMFEGKQALGHANWFYDELEQRLKNGMSREEAFCEFYPEWIRAQNICAVKPLEEDFVSNLISLQNRGITVMGLTHRQPSVAHSTLRQVNSLGVDFMKTAPSQDSFVVPAAHPTLYVQGILFVNDFNKKGDILMPFLSMIGKSPKKMVFIDDKRKNVDELEQTCSKYGIEYVGIHYTAIEHAAPVYVRELAQYQYRFLDKIMSNEAASLLMQHGLE